MLFLVFQVQAEILKKAIVNPFRFCLSDFRLKFCDNSNSIISCEIK